MVFGDYGPAMSWTYVYYKTFILNLWMNCFFMTAYYVSFVWRRDIDLGLFTIAYRPEAAVDELVYGYPFHVFPLLAIVTVVHSLSMFLFKTDYFSKSRVTTEHVYVGRMGFKPNVYQFTPIMPLTVLVFLGFSGFVMWNGPWLLREYELYNYAHNFREHTKANLLIFISLYFLLYQTFFCQGFVMGGSLLVRSILRHCVYRKHFKNN